jgi:hypothetical protein
MSFGKKVSKFRRKERVLPTSNAPRQARAMLRLGLLERGRREDVNTNLNYLHVSKDTINKAKSPIDDIL